jgi:hypothetical protein
MYLQCSHAMDKSWMKKFRGSREYININGVKEFVSFVLSNSKTKEFIVCPCKKCSLRKKLRPQEVYDHLTCGSGMLQGYSDWVCHGEKINASHNTEPIIEGSISAPVDSAPNLDEHRMLYQMLHDVFRMHDGRVDEGGSQMEAEVEAMEDAQEDTDDECVRKFYNLIKDANKPLRENTKHSKLGGHCTSL